MTDLMLDTICFDRYHIHINLLYVYSGNIIRQSIELNEKIDQHL